MKKFNFNKILKECGKRNWDGYDAEPVDKETCDVANEFLKLLPNNISFPEIDPDPDGEISLDWQYDRDKVFSMSINKNKTISYAYMDGRNRGKGKGKLTDKIPEKILSELKNFLKDKEEKDRI